MLALLTLFLCFVGLGMFDASSVSAKPPAKQIIQIKDDTKAERLDDYIEVLPENNQMYTVRDIVSGNYDGEFEPIVGRGRPNLGYNEGHFWVRFQVDNLSEKSNWLLEKIGRASCRERVYITKFDEVCQ